MPVLVKELGIEGLASLNALVPSLVEQLVSEGGWWWAKWAGRQGGLDGWWQAFNKCAVLCCTVLYCAVLDVLYCTYCCC
jgi:hypothetical protein